MRLNSCCFTPQSEWSRYDLPPRMVRAWALLLGVILFTACLASCGSDNGPECQPASSTALSAISDGARKEFAPLTLTDGRALGGGTLTNGAGQEAATLVAAKTPAGVGVWMMTTPTYEGDGGVIYSLERISMLTTSWGTIANPSADDVRKLQDCVSASLG